MSDQYLSKQLVQYEQGLTDLEKQLVVQPGAEEIRQRSLDVFLIRDSIEKQVGSIEMQEATGEILLQLTVLDKRLASLEKVIAERVDLSTLRKTIRRSEQHWWWYFEAPVTSQERFGWLWNGLTAGALALAASFMYNIYTAFQAGNADFATALSTIVQVAGLAIVGGGALTDSGKKKLHFMLQKFNVPKRLYAEATFGLSLIVLLLAFITNYSIDNAFIEDGRYHYARGELFNARIAYEQAREIDPENTEIHDNLAEIYESEGKLDEAAEQYLVGAAKGDLSSLMGLGRVLINRTDIGVEEEPDLELSESYLLMALQRAYNNTEVSAYAHYQLNRNMGWVLIQQKKYPKAVKYLEKAMEWRTQVKQYDSEGGTGNCFLAYAYEKNNQAKPAKDNWQKCIRYGKPDYIHEYRWLMEIDKHDIAYCVDTSKIVGGYSGDKPAKVRQHCQQLLSE